VQLKDAVLVGLDTETTGLDTRRDRVFEIGLVTYRSGDVVENWGRLMDPLVELDQKVVETTGVTTEEVSGQPVFAEVVDEIEKRISGQILVGYNIIDFDLPMLATEFERLGRQMPPFQVIDVLVFARQLARGGRHRLGDMAARFGVEMDTAHRATADADATVRLLYALAPSLPDDVEKLLVLQSQWSAQQQSKRAMWRDRGDGGALIGSGQAAAVAHDDKVALGPAYLYGDERDPLKAFINQYADQTVRR